MRDLRREDLRLREVKAGGEKIKAKRKRGGQGDQSSVFGRLLEMVTGHCSTVGLLCVLSSKYTMDAMLVSRVVSRLPGMLFYSLLGAHCAQFCLWHAR